QQLHAEDVGLLAFGVLLAHVDDAFQAEFRADRRRGNAVLTRARLGDDARLAHAHGEEYLPDAVVDFMRARVVQLVALEIDLRAAEMLRDARGEIKRAGAA